MNKLIFVVGVLLCSILFFSSGAITGMFLSQNSITKAESKDSEKPKRKPSAKKFNRALIGRVSRVAPIRPGMSSIRRPSIASRIPRSRMMNY